MVILAGQIFEEALVVMQVTHAPADVFGQELRDELVEQMKKIDNYPYSY